jgi:hypothetical protein
VYLLDPLLLLRRDTAGDLDFDDAEETDLERDRDEDPEAALSRPDASLSDDPEEDPLEDDILLNYLGLW